MKTRKPNKITKARKAIAESMKQQLDRVMMGMCKEAETNGIMEKLYKKSYPDIKKIVWNNPATIVILKTGEKGVCKVQSGDAWDCELGFWVAYAKALQKKTQPIHLHLLERAAGTSDHSASYGCIEKSCSWHDSSQADGTGCYKYHQHLLNTCPNYRTHK